MAGQGDIKAGRAFVEVFTDDSKLQQGLLAINKRMDAWSQQLNMMGMQAMLAAGAFSVPFVTGIKIFSDFGDQIEKMAYRTGMSTEFLSELAHAAGLSGTDIKIVETAIRGMQKTLSGAADELGSAEKKLEKLGLTLGDFKGKNPEQQFLLLIERLAEVQDETVRGAIALQIFGRAGTQLLPMAMAGAEEMRAMREEAHKLGVTFSQEDATSAALLNDDLGRLKTSFVGLSLAIGLAVAPAVRTVTQFFTDNIVAARGLTAMAIIQKTWNASIFITQSLLRGLRAGLVAIFSINIAGILSQGIAAIAFQLSALATTTIPAVVTALAGMATYALPIIIGIGAAVAAGIAIWHYFGDSIKAAFASAMESAKWFLGWIGSGLQTMVGDFSKTMGMMWSMLASGDIAGAASTLWKLIQLEWAKGCLAVSQQFGGWLDSIYSLWNSWSTSLSNIIAYTTYYFKLAWAETVAWFQSIWTPVSKFATVHGVCSQTVEKAW